MKEVYKKIKLLDGSEEQVRIYGIVTRKRGEEEIKVLHPGRGLLLYTEALADYYNIDKEEIEKVVRLTRLYLRRDSFSFTKEEARYKRTARSVFEGMLKDWGVASDHHAKGLVRSVVWDELDRKINEMRQHGGFDRSDERRVGEAYFQKLQEKPHIAAAEQFRLP